MLQQKTMVKDFMYVKINHSLNPGKVLLLRGRDHGQDITATSPGYEVGHTATSPGYEVGHTVANNGLQQISFRKSNSSCLP